MILYHAHFKNMSTDEGYIGVTSNFKARIHQHNYESQAEFRNKYNYPLYQAMREGTVYFTELARGTEEEMYALEASLRPHPNMGWNTAAGGHQGGNTLEGVKRPEHSELMKKKGFQAGNKEGSVHPILVAGFVFENKKIASEVLGINPKTIYNRIKYGLSGYESLRDEINDLV